MDVQEFEYEVVYRPGKACIADYMSRHHVDRKGSSRVFEIEAPAESVVESWHCHALNEQRAVTKEDIRAEVTKCKSCQKFVKAVQSGISDNDGELKSFMVPEVKHNLSVVNSVVCLPCQAVQPAHNNQPIKLSESPTGPWQYVETDFQGPYPNGKYIFIMIDRYSR